MSRNARVAIACALGSLVVTALLAGAAAAGLPVLPRVALAFGVLVLAPGVAWRRALGAHGPGGAWLAAGAAAGYGIAWLGLGVLLARMLGLPFTVLLRAGGPWFALPWLAAAVWTPASAASPSPSAGFPRAAAAAIVLAALLAFVHVVRLGTPVSWFTDSPDHIGTVRRMLASGEAFPTDAFFRDAGPAGVDPRKGLWHPAVALLCALAHADPLVCWRSLSALLAPLFVLNAASLAWWLGGSTAAVAGAWALLLTYGGGLGTQYLREAVFATKLADQLALAATSALFNDLAIRSVRSRLAVAGLMAGTIAAHVFGAIQFAIVFGALAMGLVVRDRAWSRDASRVLLTALTGAALVLPYLLWRAHGAYAPSNIIHTEPQGLLELAPGMIVVSVGAVWDWLGPTFVLFPLSLLVWWRARREPAVLYLLTTTCAVGVLMFVPPVVQLLLPRLGYLLMRLPWLLPASAATAFLVVTAITAWRSRRRWPLAASVTVLVLALAGPLADGARVLADPAPLAQAEEGASVERWADALAWMDRSLPHGTVVLSDPATSYSIPMLTRHWVTELVDQHSSPNDSLALERILDARDALDPYGTWPRTAAVIRRWGATAIALNGRWDDAPQLDYWAPDAPWYDAARERFDAQPAAFERVYDHDRFTVYVIHAAALDTLRGGERERPFVRPFAAADSARRLGAGLPDIVGFQLAPATASPGDTLAGSIEWHTPAPLAAGSYHVAVRFDRPLPSAIPSAPMAVSKLWRKLVERVHRQRFRFRADHLPVDGAFGVDRWQPGEVVLDRFRLVVPDDVAAGDYTVKVIMTRAPHYPNLRLQDFTSDDDALDGLAVGEVRIRPRGDR